ncbi:MAG: 3-methyl-2-oxobutanoate dehydrogenase subunit VorB [Candidatus Omnitrophica bacterium]|nr:3-methyl-2-oxobutanoate dehydrogenase subunit VorB [Candidatus Omnitrophota bacterium]
MKNKPRKKHTAPNTDKKRILITGNEAIGEAAVRAGCGFYAGYPITPQNELTAYMARRMSQERKIFIQAESEIAAINMVFGASSAGARSMTTSSSPGISLKQEGISYLAGAQLPAVIANVMRGGPGLGNIAPSQSDYFQATKGGGHGDYHLIALAPASVQECFDLTQLAFDLSDRYRNPAIILLDAFLGQMAEPIKITHQDTKTQGRKVKKEWALTGAAGRSPNVIRSFFLKDPGLEEHNLILQKKYERIKSKERRFEAFDIEDSDIIFVSYGIPFRIARQAAQRLRSEGIRAGLFRPVTLWPYPYQELEKACARKKAVFVFELSYGQMLEDVKLALGKDIPIYFYGRGGGGVFTEGELIRFAKTKIKSKP